MTGWKKEVCGNTMPQELQKVSADTYIQRKDIVLVEGTEETGMPEHYECLSRFVTVDEYNMLLAVAETVQFKQEQEIIDDYTMSLIEEGAL